jgi:antitoxin (DNA-binding transcriptional repressor) of toxin-antitoxin stability system
MGNPTEIGIFDTKTKLSEIIQRVLAGERFFITHRGKRVAELRPIEEEAHPLTRGCLKNDEYWMSDDFDAPLEDFEEYM